MIKLGQKNKAERPTKENAANWLSKFSREIVVKKKKKGMRAILESALVNLDTMYNQLTSIEGGMQKVPGIGVKTIPSIQSSYNSLRNAIRRIIREMTRKDLLTDEEREKLTEDENLEKFADLLDQETRTVQEVINAISGIPAFEEVPPEEQEKLKRTLPAFIKEVNTLQTMVTNLRREYKAENKNLEKEGKEIKTQVDILKDIVEAIENASTKDEPIPSSDVDTAIRKYNRMIKDEIEIRLKGLGYEVK